MYNFLNLNKNLKNKKILINEIDAIICDFDGVLTNNLVHLDQNGNELVTCSRSDGLAFDVLRKLKIPTYILSTEKNLVVSARAKKIKVPLIQGIQDKVNEITKLAIREGYNLHKILYIGNDLNDYLAMQLCGYTVCPADSHSRILELSSIVLSSNGGNGVIRELLEEILDLDFIKILYSE